MRYHFSRTRMPRGKKPDNKYYEGMEKLQPSHTAGESVKWCSHLGNSSAFPQKLKIELPHHPEIPFVGICPRELHKTLYTKVLNSITHNSQRVAATPMSINLWMGKPNMIYPYIEYCWSVRRNEVVIQAVIQVNLENVMLSEKCPKQKLPIVWFHLYWKAWKGYSHRDPE